MEIISLLVKTRRGVVTNQTQLVDIDDMAAPLVAVASGLDTQFTLREGKKGPFPNGPTNTAIETYVVDQTLAQIAVLAGSIFTANVTSVKGRAKAGSPLMGFNAKFICGNIKPSGTGSIFMYQEDSDPALVEYIVSQNPAAILAQITNNSVFTGWSLNGNTNGALKYIGTNDNFDFPVRVNGVETFRFLANGTIQYPLGAAAGYVLTSDGTGIATWQPAPGGAGGTQNFLDPAIDYITTPPVGPSVGDRYVVQPSGLGAWVGHDNEVAEWDGAVWTFYVPALDDYIFTTLTLKTYRFNGASWDLNPGIAILQNGNSLGAGGVRIGTNDNASLYFKTNTALRAFITNTGDSRWSSNMHVGYLVTAATARLHVRGATADLTTYALKVDNSSPATLFCVRNDGFVSVGALAPTSVEKFNVSGTTALGEKLIVLYSTDWATVGERERLYLTQGAFFVRANQHTFKPAGGGDSVMTIYSEGGANPTLNFWTDVIGATTLSITGLNVPEITANNTGRIKFNSNLGINVAPSLTTGVIIQGPGATSATYALEVTSSAPTNLFSVRGDGHIFQGVVPAPTYDDPQVFARFVNAGLMRALYLGDDIENHSTDIPKSTLRMGKGGQIMFYADYGGPGQYNYGGLMYSDYTTGLLSIRGGVGGLELLGGFSGTRGVHVSASGEVGVGGAASGIIALAVTGSTADNTRYSFVAYNSAAAGLLYVKNDGTISMPLVQTGNAGLVTGDLYFDTAANILGNGDLVCGRKV
jgi:hypothetical protein